MDLDRLRSLCCPLNRLPFSVQTSLPKMLTAGICVIWTLIRDMPVHFRGERACYVRNQLSWEKESYFVSHVKIKSNSRMSSGADGFYPGLSRQVALRQTPLVHGGDGGF